MMMPAVIFFTSLASTPVGRSRLPDALFGWFPPNSPWRFGARAFLDGAEVTERRGHVEGTKQMNNGVLHIHGQSCWHMPVLMIGNREALIRLRDAIDRILKWSKPQTVATMAADGEGYTVEVRLREADIWAPPWNNARLPYFDDIARDTRSEP